MLTCVVSELRKGMKTVCPRIWKQKLPIILGENSLSKKREFYCINNLVMTKGYFRGMLIESWDNRILDLWLIVCPKHSWLLTSRCGLVPHWCWKKDRHYSLYLLSSIRIIGNLEKALIHWKKRPKIKTKVLRIGVITRGLELWSRISKKSENVYPKTKTQRWDSKISWNN